MKPQVEASTVMFVESINIPERKTTIETLSSRAIGLLSERATTPMTVATVKANANTEKRPDRTETEGESRPTRKTK